MPERTIESPATGERLVFRLTSKDTGGELLRMDWFCSPGGFVPFAHTHPQQEERFLVVSGRPRFRVGAEVRDAGPGEVLVVPPGTAHVIRNPTDEEVHVVVEFRPALRTEFGFQDLWSGRQNRWGLPRNVLRLAVIGRAYRREVAPVDPLLRMLNFLSPPFAALGRVLGYRAAFERNR